MYMKNKTELLMRIKNVLNSIDLKTYLKIINFFEEYEVRFKRGSQLLETKSKSFRNFINFIKPL